ncbi:MAG: cysteine--tRNA ligase [Gammaproteobacteria bacterium]
MLHIYDTLSQTKKLFVPRTPGKVGMYVCGMTVYDFCHIGHARTQVAFDVVYRYLRHLGYDVTYVRNITDIDDKIIARAHEQQEDWQALTARMIQAMRDDFGLLGILPPSLEPQATHTLPQMLAMIAQLLEKEIAYIGSNGDIFFSVARYPHYGELGKRHLEELCVGARVEANPVKHQPLDFVLWKQAKPDEPAWDSPWGRGRPGWHIECSAMSTDLLGPGFDIHGGGCDLQFPHHENERAQSEATTGVTFVNFWMHAGFVQVNDEKMSKSLGNFFTIREVLKDHDPEVVRYFLISSHYRSPVNYCRYALQQAHASLARLYGALRYLPTDVPALEANQAELLSKDFYAALDDDFNLPVALASMFELAKTVQREREAQPQYAAQLANLLRIQGNLLGLLGRDPEEFFHGYSANDDSAEIEALIAQRKLAREQKDWAASDAIRDELQCRGIAIEDSSTGTTWRRITETFEPL